MYNPSTRMSGPKNTTQIHNSPSKNQRGTTDNNLEHIGVPTFADMKGSTPSETNIKKKKNYRIEVKKCSKTVNWIEKGERSEKVKHDTLDLNALTRSQKESRNSSTPIEQNIRTPHPRKTNFFHLLFHQQTKKHCRLGPVLVPQAPILRGNRSRK